MLTSRSSLVALLLGVAAASPVSTITKAPTMSTATATSTSTPAVAGNNSIKLLPAPAPGNNPQNITNLIGTRNFLMHFDSDSDPSTDSMVGTVSASGVPHPVIQLENSNFIKSIQCSDNSATIVFNDTKAYQAAVADWQQHDQFVLFSHDPNCGSGFDRGTRDYALVDNIRPNNASMTIEAALEFVDYATAVGNDTTVHVSLGHYQAPKSKRISKSSDLTWNEYPTNTLSTTQFGTGYQLLQSSDLDVICAGCGTAGDLTFSGEVDFSLFHGIKSVSASLTGNMQADMTLGLIARGLEGKIPIANVQLASITLPGFEIPEIASFGPQIDLNAAANVELNVTGTMELGTTLDWSSIDISLGLDNDNSQQASGLTPTTKPTFSASGSIAATLDLSLPLSVGVGINILDGKFNKQLAIVDTPTFALTGDTGTAGSTSCSGVELSGALENSIGANILGVTTIGLESTSIPLFSTCLGSTSPTATATTTATATPASNGTAAKESFVSFDPQK